LVALKEFAILGSLKPVALSEFVPFCEAFVSILNISDLNINELKLVLGSMTVLFEVIGALFDSVGNRSELIGLLIPKFHIADQSIHFALYNLLFEVFKKCYSGIRENMQQIFDITIASLRCGVDAFIVPVLDFWYNIAKFEHKLSKYGGECDDITLTGIPQLGPVFIDLLTRVGPDTVDSGDLNEVYLSAYAEKCLHWFCHIAGEKTFDAIVPIAGAWLQESDYSFRTAALILCKCVLEIDNHDCVLALFREHFDSLLAMITDSSVLVRTTAMSFFVKLFSKFPDFYQQPEMMEQYLRLVMAAGEADFETMGAVCQSIEALANICRHRLDPSFFSVLFPFMTQVLELPGFESSPLVVPAGDAIAALLHWMPEQSLDQAPQILQVLLGRIQHFSTLLSTAVERAPILQVMAVHCGIVNEIAIRMRQKIAPYVSVTLSVLLQCLDVRDLYMFEDAIIAIVSVIRNPFPEVAEFALRIFDHLIWAQESESPILIETSSVCICELFKEPPPLLVDATSKFTDVISRNLEHDLLPFPAKRELIFAFAQIILGVGPPALVYLDFFFNQLNQFSRHRFDVLHDETDKEIAPGFYAALLAGYTAVLKVIADTDFVEIVIKQFRVISGLLDRISQAINAGVVEENLIARTLEFLNQVLLMFPRRVSQFLTHKSVSQILLFAWEESQEDLAKYMLNRIRQL
jgi:hypothetical protein